jgi:PKD repeat protein
MKGGKILFLSFIALFFGTRPCLANEIRINEVAWMGTDESYADEWIELKNTAGEEVDIGGWRLIDDQGLAEDDRFEIKLATTTLEEGGVFLLERTDQDTLPDIKADQTYTGGLKNNGNDGNGLLLLNRKGEVADKVEAECDKKEEDCEWPAGDNDTKQTMIYCAGEWLSSPDPGGSPEKENSCPEPAKDSNKKEQSDQEPDGDDSDKEAKNGSRKEKKDRDKRLEVRDKRDKDKEQENRGELVITEIFPNPAGGSGKEFIEFYNKGEKEIELKGRKVKNDLGQEFIFGGIAAKATGITQEAVKPRKHFVLFRKDSKLILNNNGGKVELFPSDSDIPKQVLEYGRAEPGFSYVSSDHINPDRLSTSTEKFFIHSKTIKDWTWSKRSTPGGFNQIHSKNRPPTPLFSFFGAKGPKKRITFDASDTFDQDGDKLIYQWRFGDGVVVEDIVSPTHSYLEAGEYRVTLFVSDGRETSELSKDIVIGEQNGNNKKKPKKEEEKTQIRRSEAEIVINEVFPASAEENKEEWVELLNAGEKEINVADWKLKNKRSRHQIYRENSRDISIDPKQIYLVKRNGNWLELEKEDDFVELLNKNGIVMDKVRYSRAFPGESLARGANGEMFWTTAPTPGKENEITVKDSFEIDSVLSDVSVGDDRQQESGFKKVPLKKTRELPAEEKIRTEGIVAVKPGVLGSQYFYIVGSAGVQVYNFYKDFPELNPGDEVQVKGEISETRYGEKRIKTDKKEDIQILEHGDPPRPVKRTCDEIEDTAPGFLVEVAGEVVDKKGEKVYIKESSDPVLVYLQEGAGISISDIEEGERIKVAGLVSAFSDGKRILPRSGEDMEIIKNEESGAEIEADVAGTSTTSTAGLNSGQEEWVLPSEEKDDNIKIYLLAGAFTVVIAGGVLLWRKR